MEADKGAVIGQWEYWSVQTRRRILYPIGGLSSTLGQLMQDSGEAPHYPDHCNHMGGLLKIGAGVQCIFCDSFPAQYNPEFFEREQKSEP